DVLLALFWVALAILLNRRDRPFAAGVALALCASKYHLFLLVPIVLLAQRRLQMILGGITAAAALLAISSLAAGPGWPARYWTVLVDRRMNASLAIMPNLNALLGGGRSALPLLAAVDIALAAGVFLLARRWRELEWPLAVAIAAGLLISLHSFL